MEVLLEIIKTTAPALVVFLTIFLTMREYFRKEHSIRVLELQKKNRESTLPLKLQAYERMSIFMERITLPKLYLRLRTQESSPESLRVAMMVAVEQEWDHNIAQQVYVSAELWEILSYAKNEAINLIAKTGKEIGEKTTIDEFSQAFFKFLDENHQNVLQQAQIAIRKEVSLVL